VKAAFARCTVLSALAALAWTAPARAQVAAPAPDSLAVGNWRLTPVIELRERGEYRHDLDGSDRVTLVDRARLGVEADEDALRARVVLQDARSYEVPVGLDPVAGPPATAATSAYEASVEAHTAPGETFLRAGRQPVTWGEGRLLSAAEWSPAGRSLDALRGRLAVGDLAFEALAAALLDPQAVSLTAYGELFGARAEWAIDPLLGLEAYGLARIAQDDPVASLDGTVRGQTYTGALRAHGDGRGWSYGVEGAYQAGHVDASGAPRSAWAAAAHVGYTVERVALGPEVRLGASYASGDDGGHTQRGFDPLLPDVHVWHGAMDLFAWSNEEEANARVAVTPATDAVAAIEYRYARLAQAGGAWRSAYLTTIGQARANTDADLGHEIDASLAWSPWAPLDLYAGYSVLVFGGGARAITHVDQHLSHEAVVQVRLRTP
jgi:hypothetical protein